MVSLSALPTDVLEQIAILCSTPLTGLLHLMLTCRDIYHRLSIDYNTHIYASVCRQLFDVPFVSQGIPPNSAVAAELVQRLRLLRRIRHGDLSADSLSQDLWTAFGLILEDEGTNASRLAAAGLSVFVENFLRQPRAALEDRASREAWEERRDLAVWLLALTITRDDVMRKDEEAREELLRILRPLVLNKSFDSERSIQHEHVSSPQNTTAVPSDSDVVVFYSKRQQPRPRPPPVVSAAVTLYFALRQVYALQPPPNLPVDRAAAMTNHRSGPTREDYNAVAAFRTPLFAEASPSKHGGSSKRGGLRREISKPGSTSGEAGLGCSDPCLHLLHISHSCAERLSVYRYIAQCIPGVWEGSYLISPLVQSSGFEASSSTSSDADFITQKPMQCALNVEFYFSPTLPMVPAHTVDNPFDWSMDRGRIQDSEHSHRPDNTAFGAHQREDWRHPDQALDCIITGQTLADHDEAWGAFVFYGRVQRDGKIILKREPKNSWDTALGTAVFEGYLCYGASWVGTWSMPTCRGIFSMRRREALESEK